MQLTEDEINKKDMLNIVATLKEKLFYHTNMNGLAFLVDST